MAFTLNSPLTALPGVGPARAQQLEKLNLRQTGNVPSQQDDITEKWRFGGYFEVRWNAIDNTFERNN